MRAGIIASLLAASLCSAAEAVEVGAEPPEIQVPQWINEAHPGGLASLRGKVVLLEFWSTG